MQALRTAIADADALLISTPEYNGSIPGQLKNAVDWRRGPMVPELACGLTNLINNLQRALNGTGSTTSIHVAAGG